MVVSDGGTIIIGMSRSSGESRSSGGIPVSLDLRLLEVFNLKAAHTDSYENKHLICV